MMSPGDRRKTDALTDALSRCGGGFLAVVLFSFAINLLMLTAPLYMLQVFDRVLTSRSVETLVYLTLFAAFAFVVFWGLSISRSRVMVALGTWLDRRVGGDVLAASVSNSLGVKNASIQPLRDLATLRNFLTGQAIFPILDAPWTPIFIAVIFLLHPFLGWFALSGAFVLFALAVCNDLATRKTLQRATLENVTALDAAQGAARNADVIEAMGMMTHLQARWSQVMDRSLNEQASASRLSGRITASAKAVRQMLQVGILGLGAWLVLRNELTAGAMIAGSILMGRALAPVDQSITSWRLAIAARSAYQRVKTLLAQFDGLATSDPLPAPQGKLSVETVSYRHPGAKEPVLKNVSFELAAGESLGLIGPTASGKTTLARALVGSLKPQIGHVRLDGADVAAWPSGDRGQYVGYLPQDVELFSGTVRDNISRMSGGNPEAVYAAAKIAGVHELILALPLGYETEIGVGGMALSGGQRQRIALARAVYGQPRLVVLDEPNSNLDMAGEAALLEAIQHLKDEGATVVIVAHRPTILRHVDRLLVLRDGQVSMMGLRDEVLPEVVPRPHPNSADLRT